MAKVKARKVVVTFEVALSEEARETKMKTLKAQANEEAVYLGEALNGLVKKVKVEDAGE